MNIFNRIFNFKILKLAVLTNVVLTKKGVFKNTLEDFITLVSKLLFTITDFITRVPFIILGATTKFLYERTACLVRI